MVVSPLGLRLTGLTIRIISWKSGNTSDTYNIGSIYSILYSMLSGTTSGTSKISEW